MSIFSVKAYYSATPDSLRCFATTPIRGIHRIDPSLNPSDRKQACIVRSVLVSAWLIANALHQYNRLHMHRHRKLVAWPYSFQLISAVCKDLKVTCQRRTVTAYVNDPVRPHPEHCLQADLITAFSWRIYHYDIRMCQDIAAFLMLLIILRQDLFRLPFAG